MKSPVLLKVFFALVFVCGIIFGTQSCKKNKGGKYPYPYRITESGCPYPGNTIQFGYNNDYEPANNFSWKFGDGTTSTNSNPSHAYAQPGLYTVTLVIDNDPSMAATIAIQVLPLNAGSHYTALMSGVRLWNGADNEFNPPPNSTWEIVDSPLAVEIIDSGTIKFYGNTLHIVSYDTASLKALVYSDCSTGPTLYYYYDADSIVYTNLRQVGEYNYAGLVLHTP